MTSTLAILSWGAHETLVNSLKSYKEFGLVSLFDERLILFQEISDKDRELAYLYDYEYIGFDENIGIAGGYKKLIEAATGDYLLFLENDWELIEYAGPTIVQAELLIETEGIDFVRLRHRQNPGNPLWTRQFEGHEMDRPTHLLDSIHWTNPDKFSPIERLPIFYDRWFVTTSKNANWTNNPHMARTEWLREHILPRVGTRDVELDLQDWWAQQDFKVAQGEGLFKHWRLD
jgi:hypothetical protein